MEIIRVNKENIENEHICCCIADKKGDSGVTSKKAWLKERFEEGLIFKKGNVRGKVFIEYIPAEKAWCPIEAEGYMFINCLWVAGSYKGEGYGQRLLEECIKDARELGKKGVVIISSDKKLPYLSDPRFLKHKGFKICDVAKPFYELLYMSFHEDNILPRFKPCAKEGLIDDKSGIVLFYTHQCPFTEKYTALIEKAAQERRIDFKRIKYNSMEEAQNAKVPWTTYSLFIKGEFITHEILSENKFLKLIE